MIDVAGQMKAEIGVVKTLAGNFQTYCKITYSNGTTEEYRGKLFPTQSEAEEHADSLTEALRETQQAAIVKKSEVLS